ncbi:MAG: hypothetical protein GY927_19210 [bacterium]|nr:hypothetical protein [bacterium]
MFFTKKSIFLSVFIILLLNSQTAYTLNCEDYAREAVKQAEHNYSLKCGYKGDRWHYNKASHKVWCAFNTPKVRSAHYNYRKRKIEECKIKVVPGKIKIVPNPKQKGSNKKPNQGTRSKNHGLWCNNWAYDQVAVEKYYADRGCQIAGTQTRQAHYKYCYASSKRRAEQRTKLARQRGNTCIVRKKKALRSKPGRSKSGSRQSNQGSTQKPSGAVADICASYTREAYATTREALRVCKNRLSVPTSKAAIRNECLHASKPGINLLKQFKRARLGLLSNLVNTCERK